MEVGLNGPRGLHVPEHAQTAKPEKQLQKRLDPAHVLILLRRMVEKIAVIIMKIPISATRRLDVVSRFDF